MSRPIHLASISNGVILSLALGSFVLAAGPQSFSFGQQTAKNKDGQNQHARKYKISTETTRVTGPLLADGTLDLFEALNQEMSRGVTRDNNAAAVILPMLPAEIWFDQRRDAIFKRLETDLVNMDPPRLISLQSFAEAQGGIVEANMDSDFLAVLQRPWSEDDYPHIAKWLRTNENALDAIVEASKLDRYFVPYVAEDEDDFLFTQLTESTELRSIARQFAIRATNQIHRKQWTAAWADILAIKRLGKLVGSGPTLIEGLVGNAISSIGSDTAAKYLEIASSEKNVNWREHLESWGTDHAVADLHRQFDIGERLSFMEFVLRVADGQNSMMQMLNFVSGSEFGEDAATKLIDDVCTKLNEDRQIDWDEGLRWGNTYYNRLVTNLSIKDPNERKRAYDALDTKLQRFESSLPLAMAIYAAARPEFRGRTSVGVFLAIMGPAAMQIVNAEYRNQTLKMSFHWDWRRKFIASNMVNFLSNSKICRRSLTLRC